MGINVAVLFGTGKQSEKRGGMFLHSYGRQPFSGIMLDTNESCMGASSAVFIWVYGIGDDGVLEFTDFGI